MVTLFGVIVCVVAVLALAEVLQTYLGERSQREAKLKKISQRLSEIESKETEDKKD